MAFIKGKLGCGLRHADDNDELSLQYITFLKYVENFDHFYEYDLPQQSHIANIDIRRAQTRYCGNIFV